MHADDRFLIDLGLISQSGQASKVVAGIVPSLGAVTEPASEFISRVWAEVNHPITLANSLRGSVFEILIGLSLVRAGIFPFFRQAEVAFVNNSRFDFLLWEEGWNPISLSIKTSLRERYKQAELEAGALLNVHRKAQNYLITLEADEVDRRRRQLAAANEFTNLNGLVLASTQEFDELIANLRDRLFSKPLDINPMKNQFVVGG